MKPVEEAFASETFRRVILPGIVLAAGVHPLVAAWVPLIDSLYGVGPVVLLVAEIVFFGLVVSSATQWIYYVYEGFRLRPLTALADCVNKRRVDKLNALMDQLQAARASRALLEPEENQLSETYETLLDFPVRRRTDGSDEHYAERPTRLGNIIAVYELHPETRYGVDGVFYWFHLLSLAPESTRKDFSDQIAFAESLVLTSFSGALVVLLHIVVLIGFAIGSYSQRLVLVTLRSGPTTSVLFVLFGTAVWLLFYAAAIPAHREGGKIFRSIVDIVMPSFVEWLMKVKAPLASEATQQSEKVSTYLT